MSAEALLARGSLLRGSSEGAIATTGSSEAIVSHKTTRGAAAVSRGSGGSGALPYHMQAALRVGRSDEFLRVLEDVLSKVTVSPRHIIVLTAVSPIGEAGQKKKGAAGKPWHNALSEEHFWITSIPIFALVREFIV